jgi:hypothetical protein
MNKFFTLFPALFLAAVVCACKPVIIEQQRATATAFARSVLELGKQSAEQSAMLFCNVDFKMGKEEYLKKVCAEATPMGCRILSTQIEDTWQSFTAAYPAPGLVCELRSSQLLEESRQFGLPVQYWLVKLLGKDGWPKNTAIREYWLQVAEENGNWKLNRVLVLDEIRYYSALEAAKDRF